MAEELTKEEKAYVDRAYRKLYKERALEIEIANVPAHEEEGENLLAYFTERNPRTMKDLWNAIVELGREGDLSVCRVTYGNGDTAYRGAKITEDLDGHHIRHYPPGDDYFRVAESFVPGKIHYTALYSNKKKTDQ